MSVARGRRRALEILRLCHTDCTREAVGAYWQNTETGLSRAGHNSVNQTGGRRREDAHAGETETSLDYLSSQGAIVRRGRAVRY
jgi:hypothetical protein